MLLSSMQAPQVKTLIGFMSYLTDVMHTAVQGSEVIWYDSVITTGELKWQDELNDKNRYDSVLLMIFVHGFYIT